MAFGWGDHLEVCESAHGDNRVPKLDYMLGHKHISLDNDQNRDEASYCWEKMLEYGRAWTWVIHIRLMLKIDGMTVDEQHHTIGQKYRGVWQRYKYGHWALGLDTEILSGRNSDVLTAGRVDHWTDWLIGHADKNCCENKAADHRAIEKERNTGFWRLRLLVIMSLSCFSREKSFWWKRYF